MNCSDVMEMIYDEDSMSILDRLMANIHVFFCPDCAGKIERFEAAKNIMHHDFFPVSPELEDSIMSKIAEQDCSKEEIAEAHHTALGFSTRSWVITGLVIFVSLVTTFTGLEFRNIVNETGTSFLIPMGITTGIIMTVYASLFIGSHLKEFTERFGL